MFGDQIELPLEVGALRGGIAKLEAVIVEAALADRDDLVAMLADERADLAIVCVRIVDKVIAARGMTASRDV